MHKIKLLTIVGARPQFIKASALSREIESKDEFEEFIIHTGQHYDENMSDVFFKKLGIKEPTENLQVGSGSHGKQTALMLEKIEEQIRKHEPHWIILYGDTNSTLAGAIAASKINDIKIAHIEAGLRSFNKNMPEEINRIVTDHISDLLLAPTSNAMQLLEKEGLTEKSVFVGDIMLDATLHNVALAKDQRENIALPEQPYYLATIHRQENTDDPQRLITIFNAFKDLDKKVILPLHPRTAKMLTQDHYSENLQIIEPVGPLDMMWLLEHCDRVFTDSGGLQKEAYFLDKPCVTIRDETEWVETLEGNWNILTGADYDKILSASSIQPTQTKGQHYGVGDTASRILKAIKIRHDKP